MKKMKILFFSESVTMAHLIRPLTIARNLSLDDYEIHFVATHIPAFLKHHFAPFKVRELTGAVTEKDFLACLSQAKHPYTEKNLTQYVQAELKILSEIEPDLVIGDMRLTLYISAKLAQVPYMNLTNATWDPLAIQPVIVPEMPVVNWIGVPITKLFSPFIVPMKMRSLAKPFNKVARNFGVAEYGNYKEVLTSGDAVIYNDLKDLVKFKSTKSHRVQVGALNYSLPIPAPANLQIKDSRLPRILVSLGSSGPSKYLQNILDGMVELPVEVLATTSGKVVINNAPERIQTFDFLPLEQVLGKCDLVICNGGSPTGYIALSHGLPFLAIPSNLDQHQFSQAVVDRGAALVIRSDRFHKKDLIKKCQELLQNPKFKQSAQKINEQMKRENPLAEIQVLIKRMTMKYYHKKVFNSFHDDGEPLPPSPKVE